jgi:hypothetical protein
MGKYIIVGKPDMGEFYTFREATHWASWIFKITKTRYRVVPK